MPSWNELHYRRAQEFASLIGELAVNAAPVTPAPVRPAAPVAPPAASAPPAPAPTPPPAKPAAPAPTAGSLFNKMAWKK